MSYIGAHCEMDLMNNFCASNPCGEGAVCINQNSAAFFPAGMNEEGLPVTCVECPLGMDLTFTKCQNSCKYNL